MFIILNILKIKCSIKLCPNWFFQKHRIRYCDGFRIFDRQWLPMLVLPNLLTHATSLPAANDFIIINKFHCDFSSLCWMFSTVSSAVHTSTQLVTAVRSKKHGWFFMLVHTHARSYFHAAPKWTYGNWWKVETCPQLCAGCVYWAAWKNESNSTSTYQHTCKVHIYSNYLNFFK